MSLEYRKNGDRLEIVNVREDVQTYKVQDLEDEKARFQCRVAEIDVLLGKCSELKVSAVAEEEEII